MVMGFIAMTVAQLIEAFYLGLVGSAELAAVAFAFPIVMIFNALTRGIGVGTGAVLARAIGEGDRGRAARLTSHGLLLTLLFTIACALLLAWQAPRVFALLGATGEVLDLASRYMVVWTIGFPLFGISMVGSGLMRSIGDPSFPGYVMSVGALLQVVFGPPLIFGWFGIDALGISAIEGAAWAFVLARACSFLMTWWWFAREEMLRPSLTGLSASTRDILHVGGPAAATNLIQPLSMAVTTRILAGSGVAVVAGFGVASRIDAVVTMVVIGISASAAPLVGQNWGARAYDRVREALRLAYRYSLIWGVCAAVIMWLGGPFFVSLITDDPDLVEPAVMLLYIVPISIGFLGMTNVANGAFNALSKPMPPLLLSVSRVLAVYLPAAYLAHELYGYVGVYAVMVAVTVIFGLIGRTWSERTIARLISRA